MTVDCGSTIAKYLLCIFNFTFFILGTIVLSVGIWLAADKSSFIALLKVVENEQIGISRNRSKCEEPILNVVLVNNVSSITDIVQLIKHLHPNEVSLIMLLRSNDITENQINLKQLIKSEKKVIIMSNKFIASTNHLHSNQIFSIPLVPFDMNATQRFLADFFIKKLHLNGSTINIFMQHLPPKSSVTASKIGDLFTGPDGLLTELLTKYIKAIPTFWSDIGVMYPSFREWKNDPLVTERLHYREYHKHVLTNNSICSFNRTADDANIYLHMSSSMVDPDYIDREWNTDKLYPHGKDCLLVIVPRQYQVSNFLTRVVRRGEIQSIAIVLTFFVLVRIIIKKAFLDEWFLIAFKTLQVFLSQGGIFNHNGLEAAWSNILRGFSLFGITAISAILYNCLIKVQHGEIETIEDLIASNLSVAVPNTLSHQFQVFSTSLHPNLRRKIIFKDMQELDNAIMKKRDFSFAYVYQEATAQFLLTLTNFFARGTARNKGRIMKEQLYCKLTSYRIAKTSPHKRVVNDFIRRYFEFGFYEKQLEWNNRLSDAMFQTFKDKSPNEIQIVLNMEIAHEEFTQPAVIEQMAYVLIGCGALMFFLSFLGYCGAIRESQCMLTAKTKSSPKTKKSAGNAPVGMTTGNRSSISTGRVSTSTTPSAHPSTPVTQKQLSESVRLLETRVAALETIVAQLTSENTDLRQSVSNLETEVALHKGQLERQRISITGADNNVSLEQQQLNTNIIIRGVDVKQDTNTSELLAVYEGIRNHLSISDIAEFDPVNISYAILMILILIAQITLGGLAAAYKDKARTETKSFLQSTISHYYSPSERTDAVNLMWNQLMIELKCCGVNDYNDFSKSDSWNLNRGNKTIPEACCHQLLQDGKIRPRDDTCTTSPSESNSFYKQDQPIQFKPIPISTLLVDESFQFDTLPILGHPFPIIF
ncbi:CD9 antigen [Pseudolycoriella hygida]|uniref:CD9 antigen n=1 Tax=Pseudolycoriella hygida TaxID=35572 RepID=A0A9Q0N083_9DIPT|nr:CD9 antigen [Pseudolycoriella hygida]